MRSKVYNSHIFYSVSFYASGDSASYYKNSHPSLHQAILDFDFGKAAANSGRRDSFKKKDDAIKAKFNDAKIKHRRRLNQRELDLVGDELADFTREHEDFRRYMYLDNASKGKEKNLGVKDNVTVGYGTKLDNVAEAKRMNFVRLDVDPVTGDRTYAYKVHKDGRVGFDYANDADVEKNFYAIQNSAKQGGNKNADRFELDTDIAITKERGDELLLGHYRDEVVGYVKEQYRFSWGALPKKVKIALLDLAYNFGASGSMSSLKDIHEAIKARDFNEAARLVEEETEKINPAKRREAIAALLMEAAR